MVARAARIGRALFAPRRWLAVRVAADVLLLAAGSATALLTAPGSLSRGGEAALLLLPLLAPVLFAGSGLYRNRIHRRVLDDVGRVLGVAALAAVTLIAAFALAAPDSQVVPLLARGALFGGAFLAGGRLLISWCQRWARSSGLIAQPTLIVGAGAVGARVERRLAAHPELALRPVGYLDGEPLPTELVSDRRAPVLGGLSDVREVVLEHGIAHVVLGFSAVPDRLLLPLVRECERLGVEVSVVPRLFESVNNRVVLEHLGGLPLLGLRTIDPKGWQFALKHALDRIGAVVLLVLLSPVVAAIALAVRLSSPGPVIFRQLRTGRDGRRFEMLKFRTMELPAPARPRLAGPYDAAADSTSGAGFLDDVAPGGIEGRDRRTAVGALLRRTSLDELPQLVNVLKGEMSLVGPRPERPEFADAFGERISRYDDRHRVRSGMTGWAQVNGLRGKTSLSDRIEWDNYYIENWSLRLDLEILLLTLAAPFTAKGE